jgi:hypothetical protein
VAFRNRHVPLVVILDAEDGIRRAEHFLPQYREGGAAVERTWNVVLTFRIVRAPVPGYERRPLENQTVIFRSWVRREYASAGDLLAEDIQDLTHKALGWRPNDDPPPGQDCNPDPGVVVLDATPEGDSIELFFDDAAQSWTKEWRIRLLVSLATCNPVAEGCEPC